MPRVKRIAPGGSVFHVINRANGRLRLFRTEQDFLAFGKAMVEAYGRYPLAIFAWCVMGNHWHFVVRPEADGDLSRFFGFLSLLHATRWQAAHGTAGSGHVYQGRFKSFMVQEDNHLLWVLRYVERNPLRAGVVTRAQDWRWSSLHVRSRGHSAMQKLLTPWPVDVPRDWTHQVNRPQTGAEESAVTTSLKRSSPLGDAEWVEQTAREHGLRSTLRPRGRPLGWRKKRESLSKGSCPV